MQHKAFKVIIWDGPQGTSSTPVLTTEAPEINLGVYKEYNNNGLIHNIFWQ